MVLKRKALILTMILLISSRLRADDGGPRPGAVSLSLKEYLSLVETVERIDRERGRRAARSRWPR